MHCRWSQPNCCLLTLKPSHLLYSEDDMKAETLTSCCCKTKFYEWIKKGKQLNLLWRAIWFNAIFSLHIYLAVECVGVDRRARCVCAVRGGAPQQHSQQSKKWSTTKYKWHTYHIRRIYLTKLYWKLWRISVQVQFQDSSTSITFWCVFLLALKSTNQTISLFFLVFIFIFSVTTLWHY